MAGNDVANAVGDDRPLVGLRLVDGATGPMAAIARHFAELGADVIRIEPEEGAADRHAGSRCDGVSLDFVAANLGKRAAPIDRAETLLAGADILIAPRDAFDIDMLRARHPALVVLSVSDFGDTGRFRDWTGSDALFHALSGELSRSGIPGRPPLLPPGQLAIACAVVQAAYVTLVAYWQALKTGQGDHLDFSMLDGTAQALDPGYGIGGSAAGGVLASKLPRGRPDVRFMYPILACKDGFVRLCVLAPRQWQGMFEWMGRPEEFADPSFNKMPVRFQSTTLLPAMARLFADKTRLQAEEEGQRFGVPTAAVLTLEEALETEQMVARQFFKTVDLGNGLDALFPDGVLELDGRRMGIAGPAPALPSPDVEWHPRPNPIHPSNDGDRPFEGLKVLDFGVIVVGAETGRLLADQGADVVKIESSAFPDGSRQSRSTGPISPTFATGHRNRRSLGLDLRHPKGKELLYRLVRDTDVVLTNFKGGTLKTLGLDYETLKAINPRTIVVDSSAFGPTGPWSRRMGYGPLVRASSGLTVQWRYPGEADSFSDALTVYPDHVAGRIGAIGVIGLLIRRLKTNKGGQISVSQSEVMLSHMAARIAATGLERAGHPVIDADKAQSAVYACAGDDEWCVVTIRHDGDEQAIAKVIGAQTLTEWMAQQAPRDAMETLQAAGVPAAAMLRVSDLPGFDYYTERGFFRQSMHPHISEPLTMEASPVRSIRLPAPPDRPAPVFAEHTADLLNERLGLSRAEIEELLAAKVIEEFVPPTTT
ncbi:CoA transferase [Sphingobium sp. HBC34]|uniref:CoA transferase n=1 Tax=Sphingobium cyanobacteriorum TaxID=3063954 RepID=A0ABT8ZPR3_9SPHN|nr:CoA transferase [Sphingobium sp. HBC34]MDO7836433.1 CoA transferase [Sphingobium sp. HBC34]